MITSDQELKIRDAQNGILMVALGYNAEMIQYASLLIAAGPQTKAGYKKAIRDFKKIQKNHMKQFDDMVAKAEEEFTS